MRDVIRRPLVGALLIIAVTACSSDESSSTESAPTTSTTPTTIQVSTTSTTGAPTTTTVAVTTTSVTTTAVPSHEFDVWAAPADGQWFAELPIPWVYLIETPLDEDGVPSSWGWTREEAVVTVGGHPTDSEAQRDQRGQLWQWTTVEGFGDPFDFEPGTHSVAFAATFNDGVVVEESRTFHYDPSLESFTGWMVDLDQNEGSIKFAASTYESAEEDGADTGPVTSVVEYQVRDDAAFILLDVDSSGQPPASAIDFNEFIRLLDASEIGCPPSDEPWENPCFFASSSDFFAEPDAEYGAEYFVIYLKDGEIQQLEQVWSP